ncbi:MAG: prenyltransferase [Deltaproteobacteria bacterium]
MPRLLANWREIIATQNLSAGRQMDGVSRWLLITRASVFPMTLISGLIGGLLAAGQPDVDVDWASFALALAGLLVAHAANNMINDYFDLEAGVDSPGYTRTLYAPHPILSGLISRKGLLAAIAVFNAVNLAILVYLTSLRGAGVVAFALAGLAISVFYVAPPLRLKHHGFGEPGVAVVWGPLMIGGTYLVATGQMQAWVVAASLPYAMLVSSVLFGKHIDKLEADRDKEIHTLPVLLGHDRAIAATRILMIGFYAAVALLVGAGVFGVWTLVVFFSLPRLRSTLETLRQPKPEVAPAGYPLWPLWYVAWAFRLNRLSGGLLVAGLAANVFYPLYVF